MKIFISTASQCLSDKYVFNFQELSNANKLLLKHILDANEPAEIQKYEEFNILNLLIAGLEQFLNERYNKIKHQRKQSRKRTLKLAFLEEYLVEAVMNPQYFHSYTTTQSSRRRNLNRLKCSSNRSWPVMTVKGASLRWWG